MFVFIVCYYMFTILDYSSALEYSIIRRYTNIVYYIVYYYYYEALINTPFYNLCYFPECGLLLNVYNFHRISVLGHVLTYNSRY